MTNSPLVRTQSARDHRIGTITSELANAPGMILQKSLAVAIWGELSIMMLMPMIVQVAFSIIFFLIQPVYDWLPNVPLVHVGAAMLWVAMFCWAVVSIIGITEMIWAFGSYVTGGVHVLRSKFLLVTFIFGIALSIAPPYFSVFPWGLIWAGLVVIVVK